jgi:hypothetical protein
MGKPKKDNTFQKVKEFVCKPLAVLRENLALRRAAPPLSGINITPYNSYPISRSSHLSKISKHEIVEPER